MKKYLKIIKLIVLISFIVVSCRKEEIPVSKLDPKDIITIQLDMGVDYRYQLYFDLETNSMLSQNLKTDWDLGVVFSDTLVYLSLNSSKFMAAWNTQNQNFGAISSISGAEWKYDAPTGNKDSVAILSYSSSTLDVYVVDKGYDPSGNHLGYFKLQVDNITSSSITINASKLDGSDFHTIVFNQNNDKHLLAYSFDNQTEVDLEPSKYIWDLHFTQYTHIYDDGTTYLVNGVLQNEFEVLSAKVFDCDFEEIDLSDTLDFNFTSYKNNIGFDWKFYDFDTGSFLINMNQIYVIKTTENKYYKLRFIDFYNSSGLKGFPTFEYQELI